MKPNQRGRFNGRHNNNNAPARSSRPQVIFRNTSLESTGPCGKLRGTALQLHEKYLAAAKDAQIQNDDVLAETCFQYADHYMHIQNMAIANEQAQHAQQLAAKQAAEAAAVAAAAAVTAGAAQEAVAESVPTVKVVDLSEPVAEAHSEPAESVAATSVSEEPKARKILRPKTATADPA